MRFIIWKPLGPTQGFDTKKPFIITILGHSRSHICAFLIISVNVQVVSKKKKAKGIAEQVRGQNLSGLVLVLFLPEPMEGVIV